MTYPEALQYLESFINYETAAAFPRPQELKLDRMERLAALLGNPQRCLRIIHIAGSKGKGSTAAFIASILAAGNYRVGLYTSPHLISFRERIRINDELISEDDVAHFAGRLKAVTDRIPPVDMPSFFELYTALSYLYFMQKKVDYAVYEVGLGGRLDATNIVIDPLVSVITPLSYEHTGILGTTLPAIAAEKCGIIKKNVPCVSAPQEAAALQVIERTCRERSARLTVVGRDIVARELPRRPPQKTTAFTLTGAHRCYPRFETKLLGEHQIINAATAVAAVEAAAIPLTPEAVRDGVARAVWPGRLEVLGSNPIILVDGAHNRASAQVLVRALKKHFVYRRLITVVGMSRDKDADGILQELVPVSDVVIATQSAVKERALPVDLVQAALARAGAVSLATSAGTLAMALDQARAQAHTDDLILVTGSLYLVGEAKRYVETHEHAYAA